MRTDAELLHDVQAELHWDPTIDAEGITVMVAGGVATLRGHVGTFPQRWAALRAAERVTGLRSHADGLVVQLASKHERDDATIAQAVTHALTWDVEVPHERLTAKIAQGCITLAGNVAWQYQRSAAERAVRYLTGVRQIVNNIVILPGPQAADTVQRIRAALHRGAELEAHKIHVDAADGCVTLRGTVHSWAERQDIERAAWGAAGVTIVQDFITVVP